MNSSKIHYVWSYDIGDKVTKHFTGKESECRKFIKSRWGHWPGFVTISVSDNPDYVKNKMRGKQYL